MDGVRLSFRRMNVVIRKCVARDEDGSRGKSSMYLPLSEVLYFSHLQRNSSSVPDNGHG